MAERKRRPRKRVWRVEGVVSPGGGMYGGNNLNVQVVAYTMEGAMDAVQAKHPEVVFHKVMGDRYVADVIFSKEKQPRG